MRFDITIVSFISVVLALIPLPWHWRVRNASTLSIIFWLAACNITRGVNTFIWADNVIAKYHLWCDITTKLVLGTNIGLPASIMCICRHLSQVSSSSYVAPNAKERKRRTVFELSMCVGLPIIYMALHYIVQGYRFDIIEDLGCIADVYMSIPAFIILYVSPLVVSLIALVYGGIALRQVIHHRAQLQPTLQTSHSGLTTTCYLRLIVIALSEMTLTAVVTLNILYANLQSELQPWVSWEVVHENWMFVPVHPNIFMSKYNRNQTTLAWYFIPLSSVMFFAFFGLDRNVKAEYQRVFTWMKACASCVKPSRPPVLPMNVTSYNVLSAFGGVQRLPAPYSTTRHAVTLAERSDHMQSSGYETSRRIDHP